MKIINLTAVSATFELENESIYYNNDKFDVFLDGKIVIKDEKRNVFTIFNLNPNTEYEIKALDKTIKFKTKSVKKSYIIREIGLKDYTEYIQKIIDEADDDSLITIEKGIYPFKYLKLKSNLTFYLKKDAILSASTNIDDYFEIPETETIDGKIKERGTWEGSRTKMKISMINMFDLKNVDLVGEGTINGNAEKSTWWNDVKNLPYVRPHLLYINNSSYINIVGINLKNSPQWTLHPYFSDHIGIYNIYINNPFDSPNTDGIDPQFVENMEIIGVNISVGDDCIAIKSGKMALGELYKKPSNHIYIRNCLMENGHGAIVLGSEMSGGIKDIEVKRCIFSNTDRGLRIKTRRGRGKTSIVDDIVFEDILMENVLSPFTVNMFYFCDPDGKTPYVYTKTKLPVDDRTPYLGKFTFKNIKANDVEHAAGYFYGLPEMPIKEINIVDSEINVKENASYGKPVMMSFAETVSKMGFKFINVDNVNIKNVKLSGNYGLPFIFHGVKNFNHDWYN